MTLCPDPHVTITRTARAPVLLAHDADGEPANRSPVQPKPVHSTLALTPPHRRGTNGGAGYEVQMMAWGSV
jgi:hypothetical protein